MRSSKAGGSLRSGTLAARAIPTVTTAARMKGELATLPPLLKPCGHGVAEYLKGAHSDLNVATFPSVPGRCHRCSAFSASRQHGLRPGDDCLSHLFRG